ncbi:MAG: acyloxyacyl hydrolase [Tenuifilaceae bacterium]|jgi:hypothetical protein|nr:acyloxyacyl hydrolase [Tenuifilaceae bacterium]
MDRTTCLLILFWFSTCNAISASLPPDSVNRDISPGINLYWGYLQYHHQEMKILQEAPARALELSLSTRGDGSRLWHSFYCNPKYGISYKLMDLGSQSILGYAHCFFPFIEIPITQQSSSFEIDFRAGAGIGYMRKVYNPQTNHQNSAISTHINAYIDLGLLARVRVAKNTWVTGGAHLIHFSNGSLQKPNYGLNYTLVSLGLVYKKLEPNLNKKGQYAYSQEKSRLLVTGATSRKEAVGIGGPRFWVASSQLEYSIPVVTPLFRVGVSLDFMYDKSNSLILDNSNIHWDSDWETAKLGAAISTEFILEKTSLVLNFGGYYHNLSRSISNQWVYQRIALRYRFTQRLWAHIALKTHWNIADYLEVGIAYKVFGK